MADSKENCYRDLGSSRDKSIFPFTDWLLFTLLLVFAILNHKVLHNERENGNKRKETSWKGYSSPLLPSNLQWPDVWIWTNHSNAQPLPGKDRVGQPVKSIISQYRFNIRKRFFLLVQNSNMFMLFLKTWRSSESPLLPTVLWNLWLMWLSVLL